MTLDPPWISPMLLKTHPFVKCGIWNYLKIHKGGVWNYLKIFDNLTFSKQE
jgi:hypothetical protein